VERGRAVTAQLLAFSRKQRLQLTSVRLADLLAGMEDLVERAVAPLAHLTMAPIDRSWNVVADPLQLELAILNIAFNARDAMPAGGTLTISAQPSEAPPGAAAGDYIALTLADTGAGMSADTLSHAAEPFFTTKGDGHTGMGLSMAFGVVGQFGGTLDLSSEEGRGTAVTLYLPVASTEPRRDIRDDSAGDDRTTLAGARLVLVDDDQHVRAAIAETLRSAGAEVYEATGGADGVELVSAIRPDVLVVDYAMPGMSGAEVVRRVHETMPDLPILLVTGFADPTSLDLAEGARVEVLRKPFESERLLQRVAAHRRG
jgi:CheY-like chemotaxis protein